MRILKKDLKKGIVKLVPETIEDLYILEKILRPGDVIAGKTLRSMTIMRGDQVIKGEKKWISVRLKVENVKLSEHANELRVKGKIIEAPEDVELAYHTFEIKLGREVEIERKWKEYEIEKLKELKIKRPKIVICVLDDEECDITILNGSLKQAGKVRGVRGKRYDNNIEDKRKQYFESVAKRLEEIECERIVIAGPGFAKDELAKLIKERHPELMKKIVIDSVAHTGEAGINEVFRRGIVDRVVKDSLLAKETKLVEKFLERLAKDELVVYGLEETKKALEVGAVDTLLISDVMLRDNEALLELAEKIGAKIKIISSNHDAGKRFLGLGGIGGFLRFKI